MKTEEIGTLRYGNLRLVFEVSSSVGEYLSDNSISFDSMFPKTQFFYQGILTKLGISHEEEKELRVIFFGISFNGEGVLDSFEGEFEKFEGFPIHVGENIYLSDFFVEVREGKNE